MKCFIPILIFFIHSCAAQVINNKSDMEQFDISEFESHKTGGDYTRTLKDGTIIIQFGDSNGYYEKVFPPQGYFYSYKEFYGNGNRKLTGLAFKKGDFQEGTWLSYSLDGRKTGETNYNSLYHLTLDDIFKILEEKRITWSIKDKFFSITRGIVENKGLWIVEWKVLETKIELLKINDSTRDIMQDYLLMEGDR